MFVRFLFLIVQTKLLYPLRTKIGAIHELPLPLGSETDESRKTFYQRVCAAMHRPDRTATVISKDSL
jgi:hypothetical protein